MSDGDALRAAILLHPDEDTPRMVYADWLDENGNPERAEFIRAQVELATIPWVTDNNPRILPLRAREAALLAKHKADWLRGPVCEKCGGSGKGVCPNCVHWKGRVPNNCVCGGTRRFHCEPCFGLGDGGGLLRTFDYPNGQYVAPDLAVCVREPVRVEFSRGFPNTVTVPLLADVARHFPELDDEGATWQPTAWARAVVRAHPVTRFVALDRVPLYAPTDNWSWWRNTRGFDDAAYVPPAVWDLIDLPTVGEPANLVKDCATRELALSALAVALGKWCRT